MVTVLIATIIHMNMGYALPEALGRGFISALLAGLLVGAIYGLVILGVYLSSLMKGNK